MKTDIKQLLSRNIYEGLTNANQPSASNPFLTAADADAGGTTGNYGAFYDTTNQVFVAATPTAVFLNTEYLYDGIRLVAPITPATTRIEITNYGIYNIQFSAQLFNSSLAIQTVSFWLRKNGVDIVSSAKDVTIEAGASSYAADWSWLVEANPLDYFEIIFLTPVITVTLQSVAAGGGKPAIPSMLVVVIQGSKGVVGEIEEAEYKYFGAAPQVIASGGANPSSITLNTITYPVKASVTDGRSRRIVYQLVVSKNTASAGSVTLEFTLGGLVIPVVVSAGAGSYIDNNYQLTVYMNFRAGNNIEAICLVNRIVPGGSPELVSLRSFGTWDKTIVNFVITKFIRTSGTTGWTVEVKQITSELI